jgi:chromosomal replication initiation ATPase DnaA
VKLFSDRQLRIDGEIVDYMLARMERSFEAAQRLVAAIDARSLAARRDITVPLVRQVLSGFEKEQRDT